MKPTNKYKAVATVVDGIRFASKLEARRYSQLRLMQMAGDVSWFVRQPSFDLPGGIRYVADFLVVHPLEKVVVEDCKGVETRVFLMKMRLMALAYPNVEVRRLTSKEVGR